MLLREWVLLMPTVSVNLCDQCLDGVGGYCNNPECALCRSVAPDAGPIRDMTAPCDCATQRTQLLTELRERVEGHRDLLGVELRKPMGEEVHDARLNAKMEMVWGFLAILDELMEGGG